ncbi:MAG TPA: permease-like cell division protein FtsX [Longimicrobiales bacterium]|nr:permease-like cell division protein FtsX [Longimicrobiales bacterium]
MYALKEAVNAFRRSPVLSGLSASMIALSLFVIGLFGLAAHNVRLVVQGVESRVEIVAYLADDAGASSIQLAQQQIQEYPEVRAVRYVSREEALNIAHREFEELSTVLGTLEGNPLPASLEISLNPGMADADAVRGVAGRVELYPFIEDVRYGEDWLDKVFVLRRIAGAATLTLGAGFAAVAALIIGAAIRMAIFARRDEITIMRLVGATDGFIRRPFVIEGMITGIIGAILAVLATWGVYRLLSGSVFELEWLPAGWLLAGLAGGALVGLAASAIAVRRHLREIVT